MKCRLLSTNSFEQAQVCCGGSGYHGILSPDTMESKLVKGLFLVGELTDVDGICGGYNLQWAWSTGAVAGRTAGRN
ncbi:MAG: NAD(P)/FAD-dependent oxidoreductase [Clostridium sp.]